MKKIYLISLGLAALFITHNISAADAVETPKKWDDFTAQSSLLSNAKQITFVGPRSGEGYFSADGKKMIYQSEREEGNPFYQMFILDFATGKSNRISVGTGMTTCGWVHPSLKKAMWSSTHLDPNFKDKVKSELADRASAVKKSYSWSYDENFDIFESDLNGGHVKQLTHEKGYDAEGSYSPNGKLIAFASNRTAYLTPSEYTDEEKKIIEKDPSYAMEIYIMNSDGTNVKRLTNSKGYDGGPFFSADGKKITWRRFTPDGARAEIYTMNIDGTDQQQITHMDVMSWAPFFHPSGRYIIFTSSALGYSNFELFMVDAAGDGKPIRVTNQEGFDGLPSFSPDGKKLSWTHRNEKGESQIYLADWNHEEALKLIEANKTHKNVNLTLTPGINEQNVTQIINYLASDDFKGRLTGAPEEKIYTEQIAKLFEKWGLKPALGKSFFHSFEFTSSVTAGKNNKLQFKGRLEKDLKLGEDYQLSSFSKSGEFAAAPVVFAGYGIKAPATEKIAEYDSYKDLDVKGKWVLILDFQPNPAEKEVKQHLMSYSQLQHKVSVAKNNQALGVIVVSETGIKDLKFDGSFSESSLPVIKISTSAFTELLKKSDSSYKSFQDVVAAYESLKTTTGFALNSQYLSAQVDLTYNKSTGRNVIAMLGPAKLSKKSKAIIIGAHGDHLGDGSNIASSLARANEKGKFHYGADDNASGVAGVLELAQYFSGKDQLKQLKKPLYFAVWSGEEEGVIGSSSFVKEWKTQTKADFKDNFEASINMDMIGRLRDKLQVQGVASAKQWSGLSEEVSLISGAPLTLTSDPYLPTDSISFYLAEIPSISFFTGSHEDYHSPRDTADKINYKGLVKVIEIVKAFTEKLTTVSSQVVSYVKVEGDSSKNMQGRSFRIYLGTIPDYSNDGTKGVRISGTTKNSPAEQAGLKSGDVIIEFAQLKIENLYDYVFALQSLKPNNKVSIFVLRADKKVELSITPILKE